MFRTLLRTACAFLLFASTAPAQQTQPAEPASLGVNLGWWTYFTPECTFVDALKGASDWIPQLHSGGAWNTGEAIAKNADGYPASLAPGRAAAALMLREFPQGYPAGRYVCLWDGDGDLELTLDARVVRRVGNRVEADVVPTSAGVLLRILRTNPTNPVRNVRVLMPGHEATYATHPFHTRMLANWRGFGVLRFMDWARTNDSTQVRWSDRATPSYYSQATGRGVAFEHMLDLCNELDADPWLCLPHLVDDDYARQLARLVSARLEPGRAVHLEYSNECWHTGFAAGRYCRSEGQRLGLSSDPFEAQLRFYSQRAVELFRVFAQELAGSHRLVRVLAAQNANPWTSTVVLDWRNAHAEVDALAVAPYFGYGLGDPARQAEVAAMSVDAILGACWADLAATLWTTYANAQEAQRRGVRLLGYEGGQHLVGWGGTENNAAITALFVAANRRPEMAWLYVWFVEGWRAVGGGPIAMYAATVKPGKHGSWGALEHGDQDPLTAPKYFALRAWLDGFRLF